MVRGSKPSRTPTPNTDLLPHRIRSDRRVRAPRQPPRRVANPLQELSRSVPNRSVSV
jgi:hypothetical protein